MRFLPAVLGLCMTLSVLMVPTSASAASQPSIYWGAYIQNAPFDTTAVNSFQSTAGRHMSIMPWGEPWVMNGSFMPFQTTTMDAVRSTGAIPMLTWGTWSLGGGVNQSSFQLADITNGTYDSFIQQWARAAASWGHPLFLRMDHEMNGWWYPWSEQENGNHPGDFVRMWRHVHDIFTSAGANNVSWVWCPNIVSPNSTPTASLYPGSSYVDWTCWDGYNWGTDKNNSWQTFTQVASGSPSYGGHNTYREILSVAPDKPMMIGEIASSEHGGSKAAWITDMLATQLPTNFPAIKAIIWNEWNSDSTTSWPIESSSSATTAFRNGIASSFYASPTFSGISGKIQALQGSSGSSPAGSGSTATLNPVADTYTSSSSPTSTAGGTSLSLRADLSGTDTTFMRFDLSSLAGRTIKSVTLRVHTSSVSWSGATTTFDIKRVLATDWKEQYMSFVNTVPISSTVLGTSSAFQSSNTWYSVGLSASAVQPTMGSSLSLAILGRSGDVLILDSRESGSGTAPQLVITYG
jgi:hypothetical protein